MMKKSGILSLAAILTLAFIVIVLAVFWHPWRSERGLRPKLVPVEISPVIVLPFDTTRLDEEWEWLSTGLVDLFATRFNVLPPLKAVRLERLLEEISPLSLRGGMAMTAPEALDLFQARSALAGQIWSQNGSFHLKIKILRDDGHTLLMKEEQVLVSPEFLFEAIDSLSGWFIESLEWETVPRIDPLSMIITSSLPAYHHYIMAVEDYILSDDFSLPRAADHLTLATAADSSFARAHFLRAKVSDQAQALDIPMEFPEESLVQALQFPERLPPWEQLYATGWNLWLQEGDLPGAVSTLRHLTQTYREYAWHEGVPLTLGRLLAHQGRWPEAVKELEAYVRSAESPTLRKILGWGQLATANRVMGRLDGTIEALEKELSMYPEQQRNRLWWIDENLTLALLYFERGETALMEEVMSRVSETAAEDPRGVAMMGLAHFRMQQINRAEILAEKALRQSGDQALAHYLRGLLSLRQKRNWQAVANLEAACSQEFDWDFLYHTAIAHQRRGDSNSARELWGLLMDILGYEGVERVASADLGVLGILLSRMGQNEKALELGQAAVSRFPYPQAKYDLAAIYAIQGEKNMALQWLRSAYDDGFVNRRQARADFNMENLWYDPDFILLTSPE
jgi:tetratricopeptide (TPR) repeat protein